MINEFSSQDLSSWRFWYCVDECNAPYLFVWWDLQGNFWLQYASVVYLYVTVQKCRAHQSKHDKQSENLYISTIYTNAMIMQNGFGLIHLEVYLFCNGIYNLGLTNSAPRSSDYVSHRNLPCFFIRISGFRWEKKNHQIWRVEICLGSL